MGIKFTFNERYTYDILYIRPVSDGSKSYIELPNIKNETDLFNFALSFQGSTTGSQSTKVVTSYGEYIDENSSSNPDFYWKWENETKRIYFNRVYNEIVYFSYIYKTIDSNFKTDVIVRQPSILLVKEIIIPKQTTEIYFDFSQLPLYSYFTYENPKNSDIFRVGVKRTFTSSVTGDRELTLDFENNKIIYTSNTVDYILKLYYYDKAV